MNNVLFVFERKKEKERKYDNGVVLDVAVDRETKTVCDIEKRQKRRLEKEGVEGWKTTTARKKKKGKNKNKAKEKSERRKR